MNASKFFIWRGTEKGTRNVFFEGAGFSRGGKPVFYCWITEDKKPTLATVGSWLKTKLEPITEDEAKEAKQNFN